MNFLRKQTSENNKVHYRMINGQMYPYVKRQHDYVQEYLDGLIYVTEVRHNTYEVITSIEYLKQAILQVQLQTGKKSRISIVKGGEKIMDENAQDPNAVPQVNQKPDVATGEEVPGQVPAVEKTRIPVQDVSHAGESTDKVEETPTAPEAPETEAKDEAPEASTPGEATPAAPTENAEEAPSAPEAPVDGGTAQEPETPATETPVTPETPATPSDAPATDTPAETPSETPSEPAAPSEPTEPAQGTESTPENPEQPTA